MKIPLSWLKEFIPLTISPEEIAKLLTSAGLEVDSLEKTTFSFQGVVIAKVMDSQKHPQADRLSVATVFDGKNTYQVVCGAPNCRTGLISAFAPIGTILNTPEGPPFEIKKAKIRGVESCGMLCSPDELMLPSNNPSLVNGILELPEDAPVGMDLADYYGDTIFEISLTPNLGHCASILGVARELSAITGIPLNPPKINIREDSSISIHEKLTVSIQDFKNCPRYTCRYIQGIKIGPSPEWLVRRLEACGLRSVNNVVDATNYTLMELGHPLHAFDYDQLQKQQIIVKCALPGEPFTTLDNKERFMPEGSLMICDGDKSIAIAGIMGGLNSEVTDKTINVLIESAYFNPSNIRRTSKQLGLQTDASKRFERGTDPNNVIDALNRVTEMIQSLAGGIIAVGIIDAKEKSFNEEVIPCRLSRINGLLGTHLSASEVELIFKRLNFAYGWDGQDLFKVKAPTYRADLHIEVDLIEEVARLYGYDNISKQSSKALPSELPHSPVFIFEKEIRSRLISQGLQEFLTCDLIGPNLLNIVQDNATSPGAIVKVMNPVSVEQSILRFSLLPGMLSAAKYNWDHQNVNVKAFEIGRIHFKEGEKYKEPPVIGILLMGQRNQPSWDIKEQEIDFYDLKGSLEHLIHSLDIKNLTFKKSALSTFHSGRQATIMLGNIPAGSLGEVHPNVLRRLDLPQRVYYAELNLLDLMAARTSSVKMKDLAVYPASSRDWTLTLKEEVNLNTIQTIFKKINQPLLEEVKFLGLYRSDKLGQNQKNLTFRFIYRDPIKTVSQEEVESAHTYLIQNALKMLQEAHLIEENKT